MNKLDIPPDRVFDFLQKFNRTVVLDEELARQLPETEFELRFDETGLCISKKKKRSLIPSLPRLLLKY